MRDIKLKRDQAYFLGLDLTVIPRQGSGSIITLEDISNALRGIGCEVDAISSPRSSDRSKLLVIPPRHQLTGEDVRLTEEEK